MIPGRGRPLSELLGLDLDLVDVDPSGRYQIAGVYSFGRGMFGRGPINGGDTSYRRLNRLHADQFVVSKLKAFEGAVAVVPPAFDGWYLSPEFPTFSCVDGELEPAFMAQLCRWSDFWRMLASASRGIGARRERVHPERLLELVVQVPAVEIQASAARRLDEISKLASRVVADAERSDDLLVALGVSLCARPDLTDKERTEAGWRRVPLGDVMAPVREQIAVDASSDYSNLGIYSFGRGVFEKEPIQGWTTSAKVLNRVRAGQFIYSRLFAFEGAYAYVPAGFDGYHVSNEFPTFAPDPAQLDARWLASCLRSPATWGDLSGSSRGLGVRRQRVPVEAVLDYEIWVPPIEVQRSSLAQLDILEESQRAREESRARVDALLPAALNDVFARIS